ncbi:hypothetical protein Tco_0068643 [Tanacetum coccineum]
MATLEFSDKHNMVAFLQKSTVSEEFHQIVDFLTGSHIGYPFTANPTIYTSLVEQFWQTATVETINNGEQQLTVTIDGQTIAITEASVRRHLKQLTVTIDGQTTAIICLATNKTFKKTRTRTRRMGIRIPRSDVPSSVVDEAIIKEMHDGLIGYHYCF